MKIKVKHAYVIATGIKKRCRKVSQEILNIGDFPQDYPKSLAMEKIRETINGAMKSCSKASFHWDNMEIEDADGYAIRSYRLYDPENIRINLTPDYWLDSEKCTFETPCDNCNSCNPERAELEAERDQADTDYSMERDSR